MQKDLVKAYANAKINYERLGITLEIEAAVIKHLEEIGALTSCDGTCNDSECTDPNYPKCTRTHGGWNCVCTKS